ncbi:hypothetical protein [Acidovorax sp. SUPP3334]|uniref:hypothetical protein n=1 Tax=Acidovorax sp. SUPP3334 TaxID=2920881 RepID=UPI0023DE246D|nr:hypothetical protein [Acidovorax sp. SUPP3334]GKT22556.1 hypothetical protein AVHM3334_08825 [Acidovorax sp. SUPP3334]
MNDALIHQDFQALDAGRALLQADAQEDLAELCELAGDVKAVQMADITGKFCAAAQIQIFKKIRESKRIKDLPLRDAAGGLRRAQTLEEFCPLAFGRSYRAMMEAEERFDILGQEAYESASRLGLNRNALRAARALAPEKLEVVRAAIGNGSTKAEVLSVIEDLAEKVELAEAATAEAKAELKASEEVLASKNKTIDKLHRDLKRIEKLPPNEALAALKKEASAIAADAEGAILGGLRQALVKLSEHSDTATQHEVFMAGLVGQVQAQLNALRSEFSLPDVSNAADQRLAAEMSEWDKP